MPSYFRRYRRRNFRRRFRRNFKSRYYSRPRVPRPLAIRKRDTIDTICSFEVGFELYGTSGDRFTPIFSVAPFTNWFYQVPSGSRYPIVPWNRYDNLIGSFLPVVEPVRNVRGKSVTHFTQGSFLDYARLYDMCKISSVRVNLTCVGLSSLFDTGSLRPIIYGYSDKHHVCNTRFTVPDILGIGNLEQVSVHTVDMDTHDSIFGSLSRQRKVISSQGSTTMYMTSYPDGIIPRTTYVDCDYTWHGLNAEPRSEEIITADQPNFNPRFSFYVEQPSVSGTTTYRFNLRVECHMHFKGSKVTRGSGVDPFGSYLPIDPEDGFGNESTPLDPPEPVDPPVIG